MTAVQVREGNAPFLMTTKLTHLLGDMSSDGAGRTWFQCGAKGNLATIVRTNIPSKPPCKKCFPPGTSFTHAAIEVTIE